MKCNIKDARRLSSIAIMFLAVGAVGFSMIPNSFAMNSPSASTSPTKVVIGTNQITLVITGDGVGNLDSKVRVYSAGHPPIAAPNSNSPCALVPPLQGIAWDLVHAGTNVPYVFTLNSGPDPQDVVKIKFGNTPVGGFSVNTVGNPTVSTNGLVEWREVVSGLMNTDTVSQVVGDVHRYHVCGFDKGQPNQFDVLNSWTIQAPVGGSILAIDTTALLIAGVFSTGLWMIPAAAAGVSAGLAFYKIRRNH